MKYKKFMQLSLLKTVIFPSSFINPFHGTGLFLDPLKTSENLHGTGLFLDPLKTSENLGFSDVFRGYRKRPVA